MNKGNFTAKDNFPVSTYTYDFLQQMAQLAGSLAQLGGQNYILSGCSDDSTGNVGSGLIVINGEVMPFEGGTKKTKIKIEEVKESEHYAGVDYPESYIHRKAVFATNGEYSWSDFVPIITNAELNRRIASIKGEPPGTIMMWSGKIDRIQDNYMLASGQTLRTEDYPELAYKYGMEHQESFKLPDLSGQFIVGYSSTDPEYNAVGKTGGAKSKAITKEQMPNHDHVYSDDVNAKGKFLLDGQAFPAKAEDIGEEGSSGSSSGRGTLYRTSSAGGGEKFDVRPPYYTLAYLVKVKY